jgi:uncharacterized protein (DUF3820 family)
MLTDNDIMPFGKHKGRKLSEVPNGSDSKMGKREAGETGKLTQ